MANYLIYPTKVMNITQNYTNSYTHAPHSQGSPADYPIDDACSDSGRDYFYCPCDEIKIAHIYGVGKNGTNTIWLQSTSKVKMPYGEEYITILVTHPNDDDLSKLKEGQKFTRGQAMFREGNDGNATGYHFHIAIGTGNFTGTGWVKNSKGSWVNKTTGIQLKPEQAFYIDKKFTTIKNSNGITFKELPADNKETISTPTSTSNNKNFKPYLAKVTALALYIRKGPSTKYKTNGLIYKNQVYTIVDEQDGFGKLKSGAGWVSLKYMKKI